MIAMIRSPIGNTPTVTPEIQPADDERDERVDDIVDERGDDGRERAADYDADGQVNDVAARDESLEFVEPTGPFMIQTPLFFL